MSKSLDQPLSVTVVLPVYNGAAYLREAVNSLLVQELQIDEKLKVNASLYLTSLAFRYNLKFL